MNYEIFLAIQILATTSLLGLIWTVQLVHYPSFKFVSRAAFSSFHKHHTSSITLIVAPLMILELLTAILLLIVNSSLANTINLTLVIAIWMTTFFVSVPLHNKLESGIDEKAIHSLIKTNWIRTFLWSTKFLFLIALK